MAQFTCCCFAGVLKPGEARVCQVSFQAGLQPQLFSGEIYCHAAEAQCSREDEHAAAGAAGTWMQSLTLEQWQLLGSGAAADAEEEVFAQDPPRCVAAVGTVLQLLGDPRLHMQTICSGTA
jgi:hypothetical protein